MYDPVTATREFRAAYGIAQPTSMTDRARAASDVNMQAASIDHAAKELVEVLWQLLGDIENGADDEVLHRDLVRVAEELALTVLDVYQIAVQLGLDRIYDVVGEVHRSRMSALGERGPVLRSDGKVLKATTYTRPMLDTLVRLPR